MAGVGRNSYKKAKEKAKAKTNKKKTPFPMVSAKKKPKAGVIKNKPLTAAQKKSVEKQKQNNKKNKTGVIAVPGRFTKPKKGTRK